VGDGMETFDFDRWRIATGLHNAAKEDGNVAGLGVSLCWTRTVTDLL